MRISNSYFNSVEIKSEFRRSREKKKIALVSEIENKGCGSEKVGKLYVALPRGRLVMKKNRRRR